MKTTIILLLNLIFIGALAQNTNEKEITSKVSEVTVFIDKAQVSRTQNVNLQAGTTRLKFVGLSPFIDAKSVQVKTSNDLTVLAVNHQQNFLNASKKSDERKGIEAKIKKLDEAIQLEETHLQILQEQLIFLQKNQSIAGKNNGLDLTKLKEVADYYSTMLTRIKLKEIEHRNTINDLTDQKRKHVQQIQGLNKQKDFPTGEIVLKIEAKQAVQEKIKLSYLVDNAGWNPNYSIRAKTINDPLKIVYKAQVHQDTKVDWNNVKLTFSSANPNASGVAPELKTFFLDYNSKPPTYKSNISSVSGRITDTENVALPGVTIAVPGTTIGTVSDLNGDYNIMLPANASQLSFSFIGFNPKTLPIEKSTLNVQLEEDLMALEEVVVTGYGISDDLDITLEGRMAGVSLRNEHYKSSRKKEQKAIPFEQVNQQTNLEFAIEIPYTIKSDNKGFNVDMVTYEVPADYEYYAVPKLEEEAFLLANINNWEQYNLLEGEANLFFENTFVGKTILDVRTASDTLQLSLGRDRNVVVKREKLKDFSEKKFIGSKKQESLAWKTTVRNNKAQTIKLRIIDQVPVSSNQEIQVDIEELSKGKLNKEEGKVTWLFDLNPLEKKEIDLKYSVKYPKWRNLIIE